MTDFSQTLSDLTKLTPTAIAAAPPFDMKNFAGWQVPASMAGLDPVADNLSAGLNIRDDRPLNPDGMIQNCPHIQEAMITHGAGYGQGLWMLDVLTSTFLDDGQAWAHYMSKGHKTYDKADTDAMYDRKVADRAARGIGWPSCTAFENEGCKSCKTCVFKGTIKSPLNLAVPVAPLALNGESSQAFAEKATAWSPIDLKVSFSNIPHRPWLYGTYLLRGEITYEAAPGGVGKTAHTIGMAVELATGIEILGEKIWRNDLKVLYINAEDSRAEINRRVSAFYRAHAPKLAGCNLDRLSVVGVDDPRIKSLSFLRVNEKGATILNEAGVGVLETALEALRPGLLVLDPLVAFCGGGNMNDNAVMAVVSRELKRLATKFDCAILILHHTRKGSRGSDPAAEAEEISGASSIVNLARRAITLKQMTEPETKLLGVMPSEKWQYLKLVDAKSNLAPRSADSPWYRLHSVELPNPEPPIYPHGDSVQAIARVHLPLLRSAAATADDQKIRYAILSLVDHGKMIDGQSYPYSPSLAGAQNARSLLDDAMTAVANATAPRQWHPGDLKTVTERSIAKMKEDGLLVEGQMPSTGRFRRALTLRVDQSRIPSLASDTCAPLLDLAAPKQ
jgi:AAA domain